MLNRPTFGGHIIPVYISPDYRIIGLQTLNDKCVRHLDRICPIKVMIFGKDYKPSSLILKFYKLPSEMTGSD